MLTLTIKIIQQPDGIFWEIEPGDQAGAFGDEIDTAQVMLVGIEEAMKFAAKRINCPLKLVQIDDPRDKK